MPVVLMAKRQILSKHMTKGTRPRARTLTAVHDAILEDVVYPANIVGKRVRMRIDGSRLFKILLDPNDRELIEEKLSVLAAIYKKITNK